MNSSLESAYHVFRTGMFPGLNRIYLGIKKNIYKLRGEEGKFGESIALDIIKKRGRNYRLFKNRVKRFINSLVWLPDDKTGWFFCGLLKSIQLIRNNKIKYVMTTSPPHSVHLIGLILKKFLNITWIVDFRDPWSLILENKSIYARSRISDYLEKKMERSVIESADKVIFVTERMKKGYEETYPHIDGRKFVTIMNGYDIEDFQDILPLRKDERCTFTHTGTFYYGRSPETFFRAMSELIEESKIDKNLMKIKLVGDCKFVEGYSVTEMAKKYNIESIVKLYDPVPYKEALKIMVRSHVLLLFAPNQYYQIPGKAYEYLASGSDIIAFTQEGATGDLIKEYKSGIVVDPDNLPEIKQAIICCYNKFVMEKSRTINEYRGVLEPYIERFNRKVLTKQLVSLIVQ